MIRRSAPLAAAVLAAACASPTERVILLPSSSSSPAAGAVVVNRTAGGQAVLEVPYQVARVGRDAVTLETTTAQEVQRTFASLLAVQPPAARSFTLYFEPGGARLTAASAAELDGILSQASAMTAAEIDVIGHTDSRGTLEANDALGRTRAAAVAALLTARGFPAARLAVQSRGEREPLVPVPDETDEPRNRRVEIRVR